MARSSPKRPSNELRVYRSFNSAAPSPKPRQPKRGGSKPRPQLSLGRKQLRLGVILAGSILALIVSYITQITVVSPVSQDSSMTAAVHQATEDYLNSRPWRHWQLFISDRDLTGAVEQQVPLLASVTVSRSLFSHAIHLQVLPRQPAAIWQQGRGGPEYVVDEEGRVLLTATGHEKLPHIIGQSSPVTGEVSGKIVVDAMAVKSVQDWEVQLTKLKYTLDVATIGTVPREADLTLKGVPWQLRVATDVPVDQASKALAASLQEIAQKTEVVHQYIDVRIPYRVYYQ